MYAMFYCNYVNIAAKRWDYMEMDGWAVIVLLRLRVEVRRALRFDDVFLNAIDLDICMLIWILTGCCNHLEGMNLWKPIVMY